MPRPVPLDERHTHITEAGKPTKDFFNWLKKGAASWMTADSTDTLTNKTFADPSDVLGSVTVNVTGPDATGDVYYRNSAGVLTRLGIGGSGNVLTVAGGLPSWAAATPSAVTLLNTLTASNSPNLQDTTSFTSTYSSYLISWTNILPATINVTLQMLFQIGGTFVTANYQDLTVIGNSAAAVGAGPQTAFIELAGLNNLQNTGAGCSGEMRIHNPAATGIPIQYTKQSIWASGATAYSALTGGGWNTSANPVTGIQINASSGNLTSGTVKIYGTL